MYWYWPLRHKTIIFCISIIFLIYAPTFAAGIPQLINYNGTLTDTGGVPVPDGNYDVTFNIYDASTAGTVLWTEVWDAGSSQVIVNGGNFNAMLGAHIPIPLSFFSDHPVTYLGVTVGTDSEMLPRQKITSVGYAFTAGNGVPKGGIIMWSGIIAEIPAGWVLCDGSNGTPNLKDKFVLGAGGALPPAGGATSHTHTVANHTHGISADGYNHTHTYSGNTAISPQQRDASTSGTTNFSDRDHNHAFSGTTSTASANHNHGGSTVAGGAGSASSSDNLPPYFALAYIMKL